MPSVLRAAWRSGAWRLLLDGPPPTVTTRSGSRCGHGHPPGGPGTGTGGHRQRYPEHRADLQQSGPAAIFAVWRCPRRFQHRTGSCGAADPLPAQADRNGTPVARGRCDLAADRAPVAQPPVPGQQRARGAAGDAGAVQLPGCVGGAQADRWHRVDQQRAAGAAHRPSATELRPRGGDHPGTGREPVHR